MAVRKVGCGKLLELLRSITPLGFAFLNNKTSQQHTSRQLVLLYIKGLALIGKNNIRIYYVFRNVSSNCNPYDQHLP